MSLEPGTRLGPYEIAALLGAGGMGEVYQAQDTRLALGNAINALVACGCQKIILDLGGVTYIDSAGVGMMAGKLKTVRERGGDMKW